MSTLCDPRWPGPAGRKVQSFHYPAMPPGFRAAENTAAEEAARKARELAMQHELSAAVEAARKQGFSEGQAQANLAAAQSIAGERAALLSAVEEFALQRAEYFHGVETEVVRLALAIARKVLHREAAMDPLLLSGVVRVALDQMQAGTRVVLRTSPESAEEWRAFCAQHWPGRDLEVVDDSQLEAPACVLQSEVGSSQISLDGQLQEIESGFFDLLRQRPETGP